MINEFKEYEYSNANPSHTHRYLWPDLKTILLKEKANETSKQVFEIGCGNGATAKMFSDLGYEVTGIDFSKTGIEQANKAYPGLKFYVDSVCNDLALAYGKFSIVCSIEAMEHLYAPKKLVENMYSLLENNGIGIISVPYHGYLKNLALAISGKMDKHFTAVWDGGHIKFFSIKTLKKILREAGFKDINIVRVGRIPFLAKSMIAVFRR